MNVHRLILTFLTCLAVALSASAQQVPEDISGAGGTGPEYREKFYPNGRLMYQGTFRDDVPVGEMKRYNENGVLQAILDYDENGTSVRAELFYGDGSRAAEGLYTDMQKDSVWRYYSYYDGRLAAEETYELGKLNGPVRTYYNSGRLSEVVEWADDKRDGLWEQYYESGGTRLRAKYSQDQLDGAYNVYFENGSPSVEGGYSANLRHGVWTFYGEDGAVVAELHYEHGRNMDQDVTEAMQEDLFQRIEENMGKFEEPDETEFLTPSFR